MKSGFKFKGHPNHPILLRQTPMILRFSVPAWRFRPGASLLPAPASRVYQLEASLAFTGFSS